MSAADARSQELAAALAAVRQRIERACLAAGRAPEAVALVVVTKTYPAADVLRLARLGVRDVGENRDQDAAAKALAVDAGLGAPTVADEPALRWHFVGQLQRNKAASVARYAHVVHSVDRAALVQALDRGAQDAGRRLDVLLQVDLDEDPAVHAGRGGARPEQLTALADQVAATAGLRLRGVMAVAPRGQDPRPAFERLAALAGRVRTAHPGATWVSAGMSADLEDAVTCGATHLRVGSAVLGSRPPLG